LRKNKREDVWKKIDKRGEDECWNWLDRLSNGYGQMRFNNKAYGAHRFVYEEVYGMIPEGLFICHKCNNPSCCNPNHLYAGTQKDNQKQMVNEGRSAKGEMQSLSKLTTRDILKIRSLYSTNEKNQIELGKIFGVDNATISDITRRKTWKHIPMEE